MKSSKRIDLNLDQVDALLKRVFAQPNLQDLGLQMGKRLQIAHHGTFGLAILNASTISMVIVREI